MFGSIGLFPWVMPPKPIQMDTEQIKGGLQTQDVRNKLKPYATPTPKC